ncbi:hypothetical protein HY989_07025 [Candidatus Micrarchaeota archaeon]|nr:hypothetical protein [Candidatus Micrarchaeota archaeon]
MNNGGTALGLDVDLEKYQIWDRIRKNMRNVWLKLAHPLQNLKIFGLLQFALVKIFNGKNHARINSNEDG